MRDEKSKRLGREKRRETRDRQRAGKRKKMVSAWISVDVQNAALTYDRCWNMELGR